jgi:peptidoglycan-associated lipoprotein
MPCQKCALTVLTSTNTVWRQAIFILTIVLFTGTAALAQAGSVGPKTDVAYWVDHWSRTPVILFGQEEEAFYENMQVILFPWNDHDDPSNLGALDSNVQWLKKHPSVRFYVDGYASSRGDWIYNLGLSQRRAEWVKQALVSRGIADSRIKLTAGWGELYPVCPESNDECWSKNRLVRFVYSPN